MSERYEYLGQPAPQSALDIPSLPSDEDIGRIISEFSEDTWLHVNEEVSRYLASHQGRDKPKKLGIDTH
jgi:hypothetical protein